MKEVRIGIIGIGNMGMVHAKNVYDKNVENMRLCAICDTNQDKRSLAAENFKDVSIYKTHSELIKSKEIDAVIIATPHYSHPDIAIEAFENKLNVLTEKPAGVYTAQVQKMNEMAKKSNLIFAIMFNQRTNPLFIKAREMVKNGELGEIKRLVWIITDWYRTQHYYNTGGWRATWKGEGGGVLLNQAPHNLDIWQWILGMPNKITSFCQNGKYHNIEVEDDATIYAEYDNGATATFITSTGEYPGTNRLEITGDKGKLVLENGILKIFSFDMPEREQCFTIKSMSSEEKVTVTQYQTEEKETAHTGILQNFCNAILNTEKLIAKGEEGINELTISNAAYLSSWKNKTVTLPIDPNEFLNALKEKINMTTLGTNTKLH